MAIAENGCFCVQKVESILMTADVLVELHEPGRGPFAENSRRIKRRYIVTS